MFFQLLKWHWSPPICSSFSCLEFLGPGRGRGKAMSWGWTVGCLTAGSDFHREARGKTAQAAQPHHLPTCCCISPYSCWIFFSVRLKLSLKNLRLIWPFFASKISQALSFWYLNSRCFCRAGSDSSEMFTVGLSWRSVKRCEKMCKICWRVLWRFFAEFFRSLLSTVLGPHTHVYMQCIMYRYALSRPSLWLKARTLSYWSVSEENWSVIAVLHCWLAKGCLYIDHTG